MKHRLVLASASEIRARMLRAAALEIEVVPARIDEPAIQQVMLARKAPARAIAEKLAEAKAQAVSADRPRALVLGCDQVAALGDALLTKPGDAQEARDQLRALSGRTHVLYSAATLSLGERPVWHHVGRVERRMHALSPVYIDAYVARNWDSIRHAVGCYKLEEEGVRLFSAVDGDYFHVLGLPMIELLSYLRDRGEID